MFIGCILENTGHDLTGITRAALSSLFICWIYSLCVWLLGNDCFVFYLYNKSAIIEHHFTVGGPFDCLLCVYIAPDHCSSAAGGSRSTGIVEQAAELVMVRVFVAREVSVSDFC